MFIVLNSAYSLSGSIETRAFNVGRIMTLKSCDSNEIQAGFNTSFTYMDGDNEEIRVWCVEMFNDVMKRIGAV